VAAELKTLLIENNIKAKHAACALSSYCVITKKVTMPLMGGQAGGKSGKAAPELDEEKIIEAEVENIIPFPLKEINYSYQMMGLVENDENMVNTIIVAAKKEIVDGFIATFQTAGLNLVILDVDIFALTNLVEQIYNPQESSVVVVDIGAAVTNMAIIKGESVGFTREILLGGRYLTSQIEKSLNLSYEDAEKKKINGDDEVLYLFEDFIFNIASEINKTINFYASTNPNETLSKIYLTGGTSLLKGLKEKIGDYTNIEVEYLNPFAIFTESPQFVIDDPTQLDAYEDFKEFNGVALQLSSRVLDLEQ